MGLTSSSQITAVSLPEYDQELVDNDKVGMVHIYSRKIQIGIGNHHFFAIN
jgi:hypothetical protein